MSPQEFCQKLCIPESCAPLVEQALTHRSALAEGAPISNERLEFLGDAVLGLVVTEMLYTLFPERNEGELSRARALVVSRRTLAQVARQLGVDQALRLSAGEESQGGRHRPSILADAVEALIAAIYLQAGLDEVKRFVWCILGDLIQKAPEAYRAHDYKSRLQEKMHAMLRQTPEYDLLCEMGADHDKTFCVQVRLGDVVLGKGIGKSKKEAEQAAAREALARLEREESAQVEDAPTPPERHHFAR
ncbi:MAG: ribonuclease III [Armatimonadota bacterium]|nr:ribonuclease III [bacterium]MDW8289928.1 ribonuclease III [Armatimonadota bacterium]